jgi:hypothetical protein
MDSKLEKKFEFVEFESLKSAISQEILAKFLESSKEYLINCKIENIDIESIEMIKNEDQTSNARIKIESNAMNLTKFEILKKESFPGHVDQKINLKYLLTADSELVIDRNPKENEEILYPYEYHNMIVEDFERIPGSEGLIFKNKEVIEKQRAVVGYLMKKIGVNLLSGKSIMNVSLPINIFDVRSLLEV